MNDFKYSSISKRPLNLKANLLLWLLGLTCAVVFTLVASYLMTRFIVNQAMKFEAERLGKHVSMMVRRNFFEGIWDSPSIPAAKAVYRKILFGKMLVDIEKVRALKVWAPRGVLVWSSINGKTEEKSSSAAFQKALGGSAEFRLVVPDFRHSDASHDHVHSGARVLNTFVPVWRPKADKGAAPDLIIEVYSEPSYLFEQKAFVQSRVWLIVGSGSLVGLLIVMGGLFWLGRVQHEEKLTREFLKSVVNDAADPVIFTDHEQKIGFWNPAAEAFYGYSTEEIIGKNIATIIPDERRKGNNAHASKVYESGLAASFEDARLKKDGTRVQMSMTLSPIKDSSGKVVAVAGVHKDLTDRVEAENQLRRNANFDALTDLPNRAMALDRLSQTLALAERDKRGAALLFVDLDRFKNVNDTLGHAAGDRVLVEASQRLKSCIRKSDTLALGEGDGLDEVVARFGGDEFLVILPDVKNVQDTEVVAKRILDVYSKPFVLEGQEFFLTASVGLALFPEDGKDPAALMQNADTALYQSKESKRNTYRFFNPEMNHQAVDRMHIESHLRRAVEMDEFLIYCQPVIDIQTNELVGAEALLRWNNPDLGFVRPDHFISIAEETGLIVAIGEWVMRNACGEAARWQNVGSAPLRVGVNISSRQIMGENFIEIVSGILRETGLPPECLELEITERLLMDDREGTIGVFTALAEMGTSLALDDFGTGYSSLSYLKKFPFNSLKIDRTFVRDVTTDSEDAALSTAITGMAHGLNLRVIGEGVETEEQLNFLREIGCDLVQGYYFAEPLSPPEFLEFQNNWTSRHGLAV
jgi:diguanylate cyclase (GGDEF)-like protein/PAS domain S-box-containing protein